MQIFGRGSADTAVAAAVGAAACCIASAALGRCCLGLLLCIVATDADWMPMTS